LFDISLPLLLKEFIIKQVACANVARSPAYFESTAYSSLVPPFFKHHWLIGGYCSLAVVA
jgi:hypothetical protein